MAERKYVVLLSQHAMCRRGVADVLSRRGCHVLECSTYAQLSAFARSHTPIAVVLDLDHTDHDGWTLFHQTRLLFPSIRVVPFCTTLRQAASIDSIEHAGIDSARIDATSFTRLAHPRRGSPELVRLFRVWTRVTPRQRFVMRCLAVGADNRTIAHQLAVGERAVKAHVSGLLALFGLDHRTELALMLVDAGLRPA
jgi:two-component system nitrate/nitrite response regulator NarL